jgi:glutathione synthase/RimK-type ligase-like ATP-grasp enzyme
LFLTACPLAIAEMFDKTATTIKLHAAGVPVPGWWQDLSPRGDEFYHWVRNCGGRTVYLKLNTGSSATGIVALYQEDHSFRGVSTLAEIEGQFFNSRLLSHLAGPGLDRAVNFLLAEGAFAQNGIPMAQIDGQNFDVRVVCVYGQPVAMIFRLSSEPMTNLHLGGRRGDDTRCRATIPKRIWLDALDHCSQAAQSFDATIAGVDLLFERGSYQHYVLEVNAFGDFFPGWHDSRGRSIHQLEIDATAQRYGA